ncbi:MAG TPA: response regulator transcription factor [Verrucomicrobiae bacterium]|nr:response regulator transcription factor [Verrucomicrobiae bacterium]
MIRILVADDHELMRRGICQLLHARRDWQVCAEAGNGRQAVELAAQHKPEIAILDIGMPELNGFEAARQIKKTSPRTEILIFTMHETDQLVRQVLSAGALGYVLKSDAARDLASAIESLAQHKPFFSAKVSQTVLEGYLNPSSSPHDVDRVTPREREIIQLLAEGKSNKQVSDILGISIKTTETHRASIMRKLDLKSFADLVRYAVRNNIVET